jgi:hypothetical protein
MNFIKKIWKRVKSIFSCKKSEVIFQEKFCEENPNQSQTDIEMTKFNFWNSLTTNINSVDEKLEIINAIDAPPEIKNILIKYEENRKNKLKKYKDILSNKEMKEIIKTTLLSRVSCDINETDQVKYNLSLHQECQILSELFKKNNHDRSVIDLFDDMNDVMNIVLYNKSPYLTDDPRFLQLYLKIHGEQYEQIEYREQHLLAIAPAGQLEHYTKYINFQVQIFKDLKELVDVHSNDVDFNQIILYKNLEPDARFIIYRDKKNKLEYVLLPSGKWQINEYSDFWDRDY